MAKAPLDLLGRWEVNLIKHTSFIRFNPEIDAKDASRRWRTEIAPLVLEVPGILRYVQNQVVMTTTNDGPVSGPPGFDGFTSIWWSDRDAYEHAIASPQWKVADDRARAIVDSEWSARGMSAEIEARVKRVGIGAVDDGKSTPPGSPIKLIGFLRYRPDMTREQANSYWKTHHGDIALRISEMGHYIQNHAICGTGGSDPKYLGFDGYSEAWFTDFATYEHAMASRFWSELVNDGPELFDMTVFLSGIVEEHVLKN